MASAAFPSSIAGFVPIPVVYSPTATHILYARAHNNSKSAKGKEIAFPEGRTLFLVNLPPDATEREISLLFKQSGTVEKVIFDGDDDVERLLEAEKDDDEDEDDEGDDEGVQGEGEGLEEQPRKRRKTNKGPKAVAPQVVPLPPRNTRVLRRTGRSAHIIFLDASSLSRALSPPSKPRNWPRDSTVPTGLTHYAELYASLRPPMDIVKAHADSWMELFEFEQARKKRSSKYKKGEAIVDDDGFTLVTRGGAYGQTLGGGVAVASKKFQESGSASKRHRKVRKEPKEKDAFYAFQIHEKKRKGSVCFILCELEANKCLCRTHGLEDEVGGGQGEGRKIERIQEVQAVLIPGTLRVFVVSMSLFRMYIVHHFELSDDLR